MAPWGTPERVIRDAIEKLEAKAMKLTPTDIEVLRVAAGELPGPSVPGAAFNVCAEDCINAGLLDQFGRITPKGKQALRDADDERGNAPERGGKGCTPTD